MLTEKDINEIAKLHEEKAELESMLAWASDSLKATIEKSIAEIGLKADQIVEKSRL